MTNNKKVAFMGVSWSERSVSGFATGRNGWRFEFWVYPGKVYIDMRGNTDYSAKSDACQIRRALKECYSDIFNAKA